MGSTGLNHKITNPTNNQLFTERVAMQRFEFYLRVFALLSRMCLGVVFGLVTWAILPLALGWTPTVVMSGSMLPNIQIGDILVAQNLTSEQKKAITTGQVLLATNPTHPDNLVTHRVINVIKDAGFITKGDANAKADTTVVPLENVHGIERLRIPMIGIPIQTYRSGNPIPLFLFTSFLILAQLIVMLDNKKTKKTKPGSLLSHQAKPKTGRRKAAPSKSQKNIRRLTTGVGFFVSFALCIITASAAASFYGITSNSENSFKVTSDFSVAYKNSILNDSPFAYYRLNSTSGTTAIDESGNNRGATFSGMGVTYGVTGALRWDTNKAVLLDGKKGTITGASSTSGPQALTTQIWFKTSSTAGGKLIGFSTGTGTSTVADRVIYMTNAGKVVFGIDTATKSVLQSPLSYNDGKWHMATATLSGLNAALYIDGSLVSSGITTSAPTTASGFWVAGGVAFSGWLNQPTSSFFNGSVDEIAIYNKALTSAQIAADYGAA